MPDQIHFIDDVYGQKKAKALLNGFLTSGKIPHAFLFTGIEGVGKDYLAIQFSKSLNTIGIENSFLQKSINSKIDALEEPYIKYIFPLPRGKGENDDSGPLEKLSGEDIDLLREELANKILNPHHKINLPKANNIKINSIRDIKKFLSFEFSESKYRVVLISDAHLMNEEAQNALLKNLEEPPDNVVFILATTKPGNLRETIISRCWRINFEPLNEHELITILIKYFKLDKKLAEKIVPFAEGSVQNAIRLYRMDFINLKEKTISILRNSFGKKYYSAVEEINSLIEEEPSKNLEVLLKLIITWLNDLNKFRNNIEEIYFTDNLDTLQKFHSKFPYLELNSLTYELDNFSILINKNINTNLLVSNLVFQLSNVVSIKAM